MNYKKNVIISGSKGLIGKNLVQFLKLKNKNVYEIDIKKKLKNEENYFRCDITREEQVKKTIKQITKINNIDVLINNAAYNPKFNSKKYSFSNYDLNKWKKNLEVDLIGSFLLSKHVCKNFEKNNKGLIINISSVYGLVAPDQSIYSNTKKDKIGFKPLEYSVSKSGIIGFTKSLASFYSGTNIKVVSLSLGGIYTKNMNPSFIKRYSKKTIEKRLANVSEYNEFINFLCSWKLNYVSGSNFVLDGGASSVI